MQESKNARMQECKNPRIQECKNSRIQECKNARMQYSIARGVEDPHSAPVTMQPMDQSAVPKNARIIGAVVEGGIPDDFIQ
jgi:hypothetical protein